jgi:hypothetical protein
MDGPEAKGMGSQKARIAEDQERQELDMRSENRPLYSMLHILFMLYVDREGKTP